MIVANFLTELRGTGAAGHTSKHKDVIKVGLNITFHMVLRVASCSQFLAGLMAKLSNVQPPPPSKIGLHYIQESFDNLLRVVFKNFQILRQE